MKLLSDGCRLMFYLELKSSFLLIQLDTFSFFVCQESVHFFLRLFDVSSRRRSANMATVKLTVRDSFENELLIIKYPPGRHGHHGGIRHPYELQRFGGNAQSPIWLGHAG